jgi:hypothetical protein
MNTTTFIALKEANFVEKVQVMIAENSEALRRSILSAINAQDDMIVVTATSDGKEVID